MLKTNARGQVIRVYSYSSPMRKHGGDAHVTKDGTLAALDAAAHVPVLYSAARVIARKARK